MNEALVIMLALLWAIVLLPGALRSRRVNTRSSVGGFERAMDVLRRQPDGRYVMVPGDAGRIVDPWVGGAAGVVGRDRREDPTVARRRRVFTRMLAATGVLFVAALVLGGFAWTLFILSVLATAGYTALLRYLKLRRDQVRDVVRELRDDAPAEVRAERERVPVAVGETRSAEGGIAVATRPDDPWQPMSGVRIRRWDD